MCHHSAFGRYNRRTLLLSLVIISLTAGLLLLLGQPSHCECGSWFLWAGDIWSKHNSQHLFDPYSFTHVSHGLIFFMVLTLVVKDWSPHHRFLCALSLESLWEVIENSPWIINRYRENTISLEYFGDSVLNSVGDLLSCSAGFWFAATVPWWAGVTLFLGLELSLLLTIRDNLILNIVNLTGQHPELLEWQQELQAKD